MNPKDLGFTDKHMEYLTGHAQQIHAPTDFDNEVQEGLDWIASGRKAAKEGGVLPHDFTTPQGQYEKSQQDTKQRISNASQGSPPVVPAPKGPPNPPTGQQAV